MIIRFPESPLAHPLINFSTDNEVTFVIDFRINDQDIHWRPASAFCNPCKVRYDYILRFEDLAKEQQLFLNATGMVARWLQLDF